MGSEKSSFDTESINVWWTEDGICVEMPEDLLTDLEAISMERYGIGIEELLREYIRWIVEKPGEFREWIKECRKDGTTA